MNKQNRKESTRDFVWLKDLLKFLLILGLVATVWAAGWWWIDNKLIFSPQPTDITAAKGQFGDKFGAINALFAGFAFAGIIFTILLQSRELKQTKILLEAQMKDSRGQRFDGTFFQLLNLHNELTSKIAYLGDDGRKAFSGFNLRLIKGDRDYPAFRGLRKLRAEQIRELADIASRGDEYLQSDACLAQLNEMLAHLDSKDSANIRAALGRGRAPFDNYLDEKLEYQEIKARAAYEDAARDSIDSFAHYFRNLYHILKFISESDLILPDEKIRYSRILRAQLSEAELWALFYNSISPMSIDGRSGIELGCPQMGRLLRKFDILQNLSENTFIHPTHQAIFDKNNREP